MQTTSHPLRMRGLKQGEVRPSPDKEVASFTDAWIETGKISIPWDFAHVASFTDAWIETENNRYCSNYSMSHPLRMRGLKHISLRLDQHKCVASFTDAWIETYGSTGNMWIKGSHPLRMRGLKHLSNLRDE